MSEEYARTVPIIDSLGHPTLTGDWLGRGVKSGFDDLVEAAEQASFGYVCAIGMANIEDYEHRAFKAQCDLYDSLIPIAGIDPTSSVDVVEEINFVADLGFKGIKLHPRSFTESLNFDKLPIVLRAAGERDLVVFYCTYMHCGLEQAVAHDPLYTLIAALKHAPNAKVVLVHGGDVSLMRYAELARFNANLLVDLSLTLMKYEGSSIDLDIQFLFRLFDRKICIGTDFPEYQHNQVRDRFVHFAQGLPIEKIDNIAFRNVSRFLNLSDLR